LLSRAVKVVSMKTNKENWERTSFWAVVYGFLLASQQLLNWPLVRFWNASQGSITSADARSVLMGLECYHPFGVQGFLFPAVIHSRTPAAIGRFIDIGLGGSWHRCGH
jgi:hypothetical protein